MNKVYGNVKNRYILVEWKALYIPIFQIFVL